MMLENAREHGVDAHEGVRVLDVHLRGRPRRRRDDPRRGRHAARGAREGRRRRQRPGRADPESPAAARLGPDPQQGRDLDLLGRRLSRHRPRRRRDDGAADARQERLVLVHPAARQHRHASASSRRSTTCSRTAAATSRPIEEEVERCAGGEGARVERPTRVTGYFATKDYSYRATQVAGDGWVLVGDAWGFLDPLYSSGVLLALKSGELAADAIVEGLKNGDTSAAQLGKWGAGLQPGRRPHAPAGLRVLRRLQLRHSSSAATRTCAARSPTC